ncbi:T9SS type A sorting domain-containing protein [Seonamhaeicola sediminis]|uniref:T9SS type A sorting domain-containing protein n=1 Tax=Seonamhaeicola sediminis TaxID=2528206 RepID=A0A562YGT9_9FLAO|nr:T9SS type A sorting domain-containing protein [Seonamhaeicola sediminis]TWO34040.1 T9SS type A sorting domain-containing protein [Seonamhaeicola sediminis]
MMKKITFLLTLITISLGFAQQQTYLIDFEDGNVGSDASLWTSFNSNPPSEVVTNPQANGVNTDATTKVLKIVTPPLAAPGGGCAAGLETDNGTIGTWDLDSGVPSNTSLSMMVHKSTVGRIGMQLINSTGGLVVGFTDGATIPVTVANEWQLITFNFSIDASNVSKLVIFTDWTCDQGATRATESILHIDNITWGGDKVLDPVIPGPPVASFVDDFESGLGDYGVGGDGGTLTSIANPDQTAPNTSANVAQLSGINTNLYTHIEKTVADGFDLSSGDRGFSIMVRGSSTVPVKFKLEGGAVVDLDLTYTDVGNWQKLVYDVSGNTSTNNTKLVVFFDIENNTTVPGGDFQFDNIEMGALASLGTDDLKLESFKAFPNPTQDSWTIKTKNEIINTIKVYDVLGKNVLTTSPNDSEANISGKQLKTGLYFATILTQQGQQTLRLVKQ